MEQDGGVVPQVFTKLNVSPTEAAARIRAAVERLPRVSGATQQPYVSGRLNKVKYRRPYSTKWEDLDLETAMDMVADRLWDSRERTFQEKDEKSGELIIQTKAVAHLGGATLDIEENYLIKKLFAIGLGMVCISNQARI